MKIKTAVKYKLKLLCKYRTNPKFKKGRYLLKNPEYLSMAPVAAINKIRTEIAKTKRRWIFLDNKKILGFIQSSLSLSLPGLLIF